jgi:hypothetical protein
MKALLKVVAMSVLYCSAAFAESPEQSAEKILHGYVKKDYLLVAQQLAPDDLKFISEKARPVLLDRPGHEPNEVRIALFGASITSLAISKMSDTEFAAVWIPATLRLQARLNKTSSIEVSSYEIIGSIKETEALTHILARVTVGDGELQVTALRPFSFIKTKDGWKILMEDSQRAVLKKIAGISN